MRWIVMGVLGLALTSAARAKETQGAAPAASTENPSLDRDLARQLEPTMQQFEEAWNRHDPQALAATFAPDAVLINPAGRVARGRAEIEQLFADEQGGVMKGTRFSHRLTDVRQVAPGLVFLDEQITIAGARDPRGRPLPDQQIHAALLMQQRGGTWQVLEARPYALAPSGPRGVASADERSGDPAAPPPLREGTGSGASRMVVDEPAHQGP